MKHTTKRELLGMLGALEARVTALEQRALMAQGLRTEPYQPPKEMWRNICAFHDVNTAGSCTKCGMKLPI